MATPYTPAQIIDIAKVSQYLAAMDVNRQGVLGGKFDNNLANMLYTERRAVEWKHEKESSNSTDLITTSYYLYDLCGRFGLQAKFIIDNGGVPDGVPDGEVSPVNGGGGGSSTPTSPPTTTKPAPVISTSITEGTTTIELPSLAGWDIIFCRNEYTESPINRGGSYYTWIKATGTLSFSPAATTGELFQIYPI